MKKRNIFLVFIAFFFIIYSSSVIFAQNNSASDELSRDEWEWALRAVMAYKTLYQSGYYPTYDEYVLKYTNKSGLITMYQAECLGNLKTRKVIDKADTISLFVGLYLQRDGKCDAFTMSDIVKTLVEN